MHTLRIYTASWCGPCKSIKTTLETEAFYPYKGRYEFVDIDAIDRNTDRYGKLVRAVPTIMVEKDGQFVSQAVGSPSPAALRNLFEKGSL